MHATRYALHLKGVFDSIVIIIFSLYVSLINPEIKAL